MMIDTKNSISQGYTNEIKFQENMLRNLQHWQSVFSVLVGIGVLITYFLRHQSIWLLITSIVISVMIAILMFTVGYGIYKGKQNVAKLIDSYEKIIINTTK